MTKIINFKEMSEMKKSEIVYIHQETGFFDVAFSFLIEENEIWFEQKILAWAVLFSGEITPVFLHNDEIFTFDKLKKYKNINYIGYYDRYNEAKNEDLPEFKIQEIKNANRYYQNSSALVKNLYINENNKTHTIVVTELGKIQIIEINCWTISSDRRTLVPCLSQKNGRFLRIDLIEDLGTISGLYSYESATELKNNLM